MTRGCLGKEAAGRGGRKGRQVGRQGRKACRWGRGRQVGRKLGRKAAGRQGKAASLTQVCSLHARHAACHAMPSHLIGLQPPLVQPLSPSHPNLQPQTCPVRIECPWWGRQWGRGGVGQQGAVWAQWGNAGGRKVVGVGMHARQAW